MKIDVTTIDGYADMTAEEKLALLENYEVEIPQPDYTGYIKKDMYDKLSSEIAKIKKERDALLTEDEKTKMAYNEEVETLRQRVADMERDTKLAEIKSNYISMGYDEELALDTAQATVDGDNAKIIANLRKFLEAHDKAFEANLLAKTPRPDGGGANNSPKQKTRAEIEAIDDTTERRQAMKENIDLFPELQA